MKIDESLVKRLETLSMVEIEDKTAMAKDLDEIVEFVEMLNELDTDGIDAAFSTLNSSTYLREDKACKNNVVAEILEHAPKAKDGFFIVPKIIE